MLIGMQKEKNSGVNLMRQGKNKGFSWELKEQNISVRSRGGARLKD